MRKWLVRSVLLAALVAVAVFLRRTVFAPERIEVRVVEADRGLVESTVTNSKAGTIEARRRARLSPGTSGVVIELPVKRGMRVSAGEVLMRLDDSSQRAALLLNQRALEVAEATNQKACLAEDRAERELERNRELEGSIISTDLLDRLESAHELAQADCAVAASQVEQAKAAVEAAEAELEKTVLYAPFDAVIAEVSIEIGEWVTPSVPLLVAPDVLDAIDLTSLYVSAPMDEVDAALLHPGQIARVSIDPFPGRSFAGRVQLVAPYVLDLEKQNRTIEVEVVLDDQEFSATLLPGTSADVEVILDTHENVLRIPSHTLLEGQRVLLVRDDVLEERAVAIGLRNWEWAEVTGGLEKGEKVVASLDIEGVEAGARVRVRE